MTGKRRNNANSVSFSNSRSKKVQQPNLQVRRIWWSEGNAFVKMKLSTKALKTIELKGLAQVAKDNGVDLSKYRLY